MLFSRLALLLVLIEWGCIAYGFFINSGKVLYHMFVYGSPLYMAFNFFQADSILHEGTRIIVVLFVFHLLKYFSLFKAKAADEDNGNLWLAIGGEIAYLAYSGYMLY